MDGSSVRVTPLAASQMSEEASRGVGEVSSTDSALLRRHVIA